MARLVLTEVLTLGVSVTLLATDWQIALDPDFNNLLVDVVMDEDNVYSLTTPIRNPNGTIYTGNGPLYARCRIFVGDEYMAWYELPNCLPEELNALDEDGRHALLDEISEINVY